MHLIVDVAGMVKVLSGESALQAGDSHPKCHGVHIDKMGVGLGE